MKQEKKTKQITNYENDILAHKKQAESYGDFWDKLFRLNENVLFTRTPDIELRRRRLEAQAFALKALELSQELGQESFPEENEEAMEQELAAPSVSRQANARLDQFADPFALARSADLEAALAAHNLANFPAQGQSLLGDEDLAWGAAGPKPSALTSAESSRGSSVPASEEMSPWPSALTSAEGGLGASAPASAKLSQVPGASASEEISPWPGALTSAEGGLGPSAPASAKLSQVPGAAVSEEISPWPHAPISEKLSPWPRALTSTQPEPGPSAAASEEISPRPGALTSAAVTPAYHKQTSRMIVSAADGAMASTVAPLNSAHDSKPPVSAYGFTNGANYLNDALFFELQHLKGASSLCAANPTAQPDALAQPHKAPAQPDQEPAQPAKASAQPHKAPPLEPAAATSPLSGRFSLENAALSAAEPKEQLLSPPAMLHQELKAAFNSQNPAMAKAAPKCQMVEGFEAYPQAAGVAKAYPQVSGAAEICRQIAGAGKAYPEVAELAKACPEVAEAATAYPQVSGAAEICPQIAAAGKAYTEVAGVAKACPEVAETAKAFPQIAGAGKAYPEVAEVAKAYPEVVEAATAYPQAAEAAKSAPQVSGAAEICRQIAEACKAYPEVAEAAETCPQAAEAAKACPQAAEPATAAAQAQEQAGASLFAVPAGQLFASNLYISQLSLTKFSLTKRAQLAKGKAEKADRAQKIDKRDKHAKHDKRDVTPAVSDLSEGASRQTELAAPLAPNLPPKNAAQNACQAASGYQTPPLDLLQLPFGAKEEEREEENLERCAGMLENILEDFGIKGEIIHVRPGPVVTLYEFEPAAGVKSARVIGLTEDIARSMSAVSARVAVIPGRNVIGIELPNQIRETVYLRELLQDDNFQASCGKLSLALGKNIGGEIEIVELAKMPHLLVAGTTGSGKSVAINAMILSLLYRLSPQQCRLIMVDPKMLELSIYDGIPHLLTPVVTDPKKAVMALKWAVKEMEDRYRKMARLAVRNIDSYNLRIEKIRDQGDNPSLNGMEGFDLPLETLPYIVIIVDEMADLMMVAGKEIEGAIQRLAQMARAAGIHLIMATQRPSVDVITGTIKANFPTRISFAVTSKIDSRTILGEQGAETLLGQGDMLYMASGGRLMRIHGPFVSDGEIAKVVSFLKTQGQPEYLSQVTDSESAERPNKENGSVADIVASNGNIDDFNELYLQAVKLVLRDKKCSTSYIQRRLAIGYNRAASLVEKMEAEGIVGPANHVGKREILLAS